MVNASASKYSTTHSACLAFYVAQVSDFVSQLSRVTFYGFVSRSVSGCLEPENKIYRAVFSPTGWIINIYSPVLPLSCSHWNWRELYIYKQRQKQTGKPSPSVLTRTKIPVRNWQASLFVSCLAYFLSPFRTCEGIGLVSLLAVTGDSSIFWFDSLPPAYPPGLSWVSLRLGEAAEEPWPSCQACCVRFPGLRCWCWAACPAGGKTRVRGASFPHLPWVSTAHPKGTVYIIWEASSF